jgi:RimJ/RimL family protein N-acetyltransferase
MKSLPIIKGKNIILRPLALKDAPRFVKWLDDPEVTQFLDVHNLPTPTLKEEREWITEAKKDKTKACFAIDTKDGVHIGTVSLVKIHPVDKRAEYGIFIGNKMYWGQGLANRTL